MCRPSLTSFSWPSNLSPSSSLADQHSRPSDADRFVPLTITDGDSSSSDNAVPPAPVDQEPKSTLNASDTFPYATDMQHDLSTLEAYAPPATSVSDVAVASSSNDTSPASSVSETYSAPSSSSAPTSLPPWPTDSFPTLSVPDP